MANFQTKIFEPFWTFDILKCRRFPQPTCFWKWAKGTCLCDMGCDIAYICVATIIYMARVISPHKNGCVSEPVADIFHPMRHEQQHLLHPTSLN